MNLPAGVTQRDITALCADESTTKICDNCARECEYDRDNGKWYYAGPDDPLGPVVPENTQEGWFCSGDCHESFLEKKAPAVAMVRQGLGLVVNGAPRRLFLCIAAATVERP